jgi:hypothetical protein
MKNVIKVLGIIALAAVIGLSFTGCDTGEGEVPPEPAGPQKMVYTWKSGNDSYKLEITEDANSRAVYTPKSGDTYVLTINPGNKKSSGTVTISANTFTLKPSNSTTIFTITVTPTATNVLVTGMGGTITLEDGTTKPAPATSTPTKEFATFELKAEKFPNIEIWTNGFILTDLTDQKPKKGDKLKFEIRGEMKEPLKWFSAGIYSDGTWLGGSGDPYIREIAATFNTSFTIEVENAPSVNGSVNVFINNILWQIGDGDNSDWKHESGFRVQDSDVGKVKATISNFRICLVEITPKS